MRFEFATAQRILFGPGVAAEISSSAAQYGGRVLLLTGGDPDRVVRHMGSTPHVAAKVRNEPTVDLVRDLVSLARSEGCEVVVSIGGGSVIDAGKAVAALLGAGDPLDYLEVIGGGLPLRAPSVPFIAVPTTAGAGAEVTRNAVLASPADGVKASLRSPSMLPAIALVDPELTLDLPPALTASTGLDALTQLIEPYVSVRANPFTDSYCLEAIPRAARALPKAFRNGHDRHARIDMSLASLSGGVALANAGLGAVHGFAAPIGGAFPAPHGAVCAALLPHVMRANLQAMRQRDKANPALVRYRTVAQLLTGDPAAEADHGVDWVAQLCAELEIPPLRKYGLSAAAAPALVANAAKASSMKGNPLPLTPQELTDILLAAI